MGKVSVLVGTLQSYAWGRPDALTPWLPTAPAGPHAELWFGAHPHGPSTVVQGPSVSTSCAPLLVKLLAAGAPLSIQVHPDAAGIHHLQSDPLTRGLLADSAVKSEALIAVETFAVLAGLRSPQDAHRLLSVGLSADSAALSAVRAGDMAAAIRTLFAEQPKFNAAAALAELAPVERRVMERVVSRYPADTGLPVAFMMRPWVLKPGQAMFLRAGCIHAYVDGFGVEVMTSSDNVLRIGLTSKQVALEPALSVLDVTAQPTVVELGDTPNTCTGFPFSVQRVRESSTCVADAGSVVLCVDGEAQAECGAAISIGQAALLHDGECLWQVSGDVYIARPTAGN